MRSGFPTGELSVQWRRVSATLVALVVVASCRSDAGDDGPELGLDDGADVEVEPDHASSAEDDGDGSSAEEDPLYPPLPPLEPDTTSDISIEDQESFYALYEAYYETVQSAFVTGDVTRLPDVLHGEALETSIETIESNVTEGRAFRFPDTEVRWVATVEVQNGPAVVQECRIFGPHSGLWDLEAGEPVEVGERFGRLFQARFELVEVDDAVGYRVVEVLATDGEERCDA